MLLLVKEKISRLRCEETKRKIKDITVKFRESKQKENPREENYVYFLFSLSSSLKFGSTNKTKNIFPP